ncbi:MAG: outer membrane beta-barrel protein [Bacteroidales bacterium]|nr:outer membrane beta-barrel protein [Candidatus Liminaster caballi]
MKKLIISALAIASAATAFAGGINTNTNQNAAFLRQLSQEAVIDITGLYANPAGTAFLAPGSHFSINIQNAKQTREIETTLNPLFALNANTPGEATHNFKGEAYAPVIPSIHYSYNWDKWSINAHFALTGGGGKCEFDKGLGSFEALYASEMYKLVPTKVNGMVMDNVKAGLMGKGLPEAAADALVAGGTFNSQMTGYSLNAYMKGKQYYFGLQLGATYKALDNLAVFAGLRGVYATCNYNGYVQDINASYAYSFDVPVPGMDNLTGADKGQTSLADRELALNADQTGFGFTPMIGVDWKINEHWNVAAKYEFKTRMRLENKSEMNEFAAATAKENATLGQFADGSKIAADIPSVLFAGVQYSPIESIRLNAGYHFYGDKKATQYNNKQDLIDDNTFEVTAGVEWDVCKLITLSCSYQTTKYGLSDGYMNDLSFVVDSWSYGLGARINCTEKLSLDLGFMQTLYDDRTVIKPEEGNKKDVYTRTNRVLGIGLNYKF